MCAGKTSNSAAPSPIALPHEGERDPRTDTNTREESPAGASAFFDAPSPQSHVLPAAATNGPALAPAITRTPSLPMPVLPGTALIQDDLPSARPNESPADQKEGEKRTEAPKDDSNPNESAPAVEMTPITPIVPSLPAPVNTEPVSPHAPSFFLPFPQKIFSNARLELKF